MAARAMGVRGFQHSTTEEEDFVVVHRGQGQKLTPSPQPATPQPRDWNRAASGGPGKYAVLHCKGLQVNDSTANRVALVKDGVLTVDGTVIKLNLGSRAISPLLVKDGPDGTFLLSVRGIMKTWTVGNQKILTLQ